MSHNNYLLDMQAKFNRLPFGQRLFSKVFAAKAPYFKTIKPFIETLEPNRCCVRLPKRKAVHNHIGTVHAIAVCNALEMAMGAMAEASIPKHLRWLPKGLNVNYVAKSTTDLIAEATVDADAWQPGDVNVTVKATDANGHVVVEGIIPLWVTEKPKK
ncbi:hotdog fold domain-containing protein [Reinekea blandensis]|uniref:Thioesterase (4HBT) superfamily enzyme n=1 Tax=Reinekea blandensis MED297 TaxID=314283 RepID=A4B9P6_9GAMM|nr:hotdog fold domain-containing protein [Reinekea blandensis]EAR11347.1 Thioesterase (4HBT) superfamily enzyme [Reinekea sp. MED297] [Reinekea blandensis MED297]